MPKDTPAPEPHEPALLAQHRALGHCLIPLHRWDHDADAQRGKSPRDAGWRAIDYSRFDAGAHMLSGGNVGVRLRAEDLVVDVDPRNFEGADPTPEFFELCGVDPDACPTVHTGSGGRHLYMRRPAGPRLLVSLDRFPGVEVKSVGAQVVAAGSVHPGTGLAYRWDPLAAAEAPEAPPRLLEMFARPDGPAASGGGEHTPEQLAAMLGGLDAHDFASNEAWYSLMAACHHATAGLARQEFLDWCAGDGRYRGKLRESAKRWDSMSARPAGPAITAKTLHMILRDAGRAELIPRDSAEDEFHGVSVDLPEGAAASASASLPGQLAAVSQQWVYVADAHAFVRRSDGKKYGPEQWKALHASAWPDGDVLTAVWKGKLPVSKRESLVYIPHRSEFLEEGLAYNLWKPSGVEAREGDVGPFLAHVEYLLPEAADRDRLLDYMALLVQRPADKIMFALLLRGEPGTGKSWVGLLM
jgi:hypothetical protein